MTLIFSLDWQVLQHLGVKLFADIFPKSETFNVICRQMLHSAVQVDIHM